MEKIQSIKNMNKIDNSIIYDTHLINATYYVDFKINREVLHKALVNPEIPAFVAQ